MPKSQKTDKSEGLKGETSKSEATPKRAAKKGLGEASSLENAHGESSVTPSVVVVQEVLSATSLAASGDVSAELMTNVLVSEEEVVLTDAEGRRLCRVRDCDQAATVEVWCRYHYLLNWKRIQAKREIMAGGKLERYVEELTARYPDKFLEILRKDLRTEKDFMAAIAELEIDESALDNDYEEDSQSLLDEVRGVSESAGMGGGDGGGSGSSSSDDDY